MASVQEIRVHLPNLGKYQSLLFILVEWLISVRVGTFMVLWLGVWPGEVGPG